MRHLEQETLDIHIRNMRPDDIPAAMQLKEWAGWNQVPADWEAYLLLEPRGCFVAEVEGKVVASTTNINYQRRFGWIGMVIVDPAWRRRGIATQMVHRAIAYLESVSCPCQKLDATEAGARVYETMGFTVEYQVERWLGRSARLAAESEGELAILSRDHLDSLERLDTDAFGALRRPLLEWYCSNTSPRFVLLDPSRDREPAGKSDTHLFRPQGYLVGRPGSKWWQMGPLVAEDAKAAERLMRRFLSALPEAPIIADVVAHHQEAVRLLEGFGFERQRVLQRMYRGENRWTGRPGPTFCLCGFEYG